MSTKIEGDGALKPKSEKELEKERKKAEKLAKFEAKQKAKAASQPKASSNSKNVEKAKVQETAVFVDKTVPGEKKILLSLDDPTLKAYSPAAVESSWYDWWNKMGFFEPQLTEQGDIKPQGKFVIPIPPPNVTGALHIGHALTFAIQDSLVRYYRMKGLSVLFVPGFDHAGISTQSVVEKMLWSKEQKTRHDLGREKFTDLVWDWKTEYHKRIKNQLSRLGASFDWSREAFTLDETRSKAVAEAFVQLHEDGTIYRANRLVNWCVALNTTLSNLEVDNKEIPGRTLLKVPGYDEPVEFGVITSFAYPIEGSDEKLIVATTRPETLFGDSGVAVHPDDARYKHLHGKFCVHPFVKDRKIPIICDAEAVDMEFGTGAVKITPAHDPNDYATGKRHNLEFINILNDNGTLNGNSGSYEGMKRFDARKRVIEELKEMGLFIEQKDNAMSIPLCEKSKDVIEPVMKPQWWVRQKDQAEAALKAVKDGSLNISPKTSENDFHIWLNNIQDWCISRQLWWGHRCPVYFVCFEGENFEELDKSVEDRWISGRTESEAIEKAEKKFPSKKFTLHQDEDVLDTWFSSGLWPFSTLGWPDKNSEDLKRFYPMSMLETGWDILFFWVARMVMLGIKLTGQVPFSEVFCHSLVRDAQGRKMSKSLGNVIDPLDMISGVSLETLFEKLKQGNLDPREVKKASEGQKASYPNGIPECGTDALRFALCNYTTGGRDINLDVNRVEGYRRFCNKIYQATKFALMRLGENYHPPSKPAISGKESLVERWILDKLFHASSSVSECLENRDFFNATNAVYNFWLREFCDVYIENSKYLIMEGTAEEKKSAQDTLFTCLEGALKITHPFMPFLTEELWQRIPKRAGDETPSIMVSDFPAYPKDFVSEDSVSSYDLILDIVSGIRSLMASYGIAKDGSVAVQASEKVISTLRAQETSMLSLVKAAKAMDIIGENDTVPKGAVASVINPECSVFVILKGHVDLDAEIKKAEKSMEAKNKSLASLKKQMELPNYETKVPKEVRDKNSEKVDTLNGEVDGLKAVIAEFNKLKLE